LFFNSATYNSEIGFLPDTVLAINPIMKAYAVNLAK